MMINIVEPGHVPGHTISAAGHGDSATAIFSGEVRPHLKLGITWRGFQTFCFQELEILHYPFSKKEGVYSAVLMMFKEVDVIRARWRYTAPGEPDAWIAESYPDELTCYDLNAVIKRWLHANGASDRSI